MEVLNSAIKSFVKAVLDEASKKIADKFSLSIDEVSSIWSDIYVDLDVSKPISIKQSDKSDKKVTKITKTKTTKKTKKIKEESDVDSDSEAENKENEDGCVHRLLRGPRSGECCGEKVSKKSQTGRYCTKHIAHENKAQVEKKPKREISESTDMKYKISKNKFGNYTHVQTGLVFKSAQEKIVCGRQDDDGSIHPLTEEDIETCKKLKFPFVQNEINETSEVEDEDN